MKLQEILPDKQQKRRPVAGIKKASECAADGQMEEVLFFLGGSDIGVHAATSNRPTPFLFPSDTQPDMHRSAAASLIGVLASGRAWMEEREGGQGSGGKGGETGATTDTTPRAASFAMRAYTGPSIC
jgi:hypothetical protein